MWPSQVRPTPDRVASAFTLAALTLCLCGVVRARAGGEAPDAPAPPDLERRADAAADPFGPIAGDKQRVPKPPDQPRYKPGSNTPPSTPSSSSSSSDDEGSTCFDNCFPGSTPSESSEPSPAQQLAVVQTKAWAVDDRGWLRAAVKGDSLTLRAASMVPDRPDTVTGRLPDGAEVVVIETYRTDDGLKVRVRPIDALEPDGWLPATSVTDKRPKPPKPVAVAPVAPASPRGAARVQEPRVPAAQTPALVGAQFVIAGTLPLTRGFEHEYDDGGLHVEVNVMDYLEDELTTGGGFGFWSMTGKPKLMYTSPTQWDIPAESRLEIYDLALKIGGNGGTQRARYRVLLGPALFLVHERARLEAYTPEMGRLGSIRESLLRFAGGGVLSVGGVLRTSGHFEYGIVLNAVGIAWQGHEEKSLATDFVHHGLFQFDFGLTFAYPTR